MLLPLNVRLTRKLPRGLRALAPCTRHIPARRHRARSRVCMHARPCTPPVCVRRWVVKEAPDTKIKTDNLKKLQAAAKFKKAAQKLMAMQKLAKFTAAAKAAA